MNFPAVLQSNPDAALLTLLAGVLLVYWECNRPGFILPGCIGALLSLLAANAFAHMPLRPPGIILAVSGFALVVCQIFLPVRKLLAAAGTVAATAALIAGLATCVQPSASARVHLPTAFATGLCLAAASLWLARIALRARRNKRTFTSLPAASQRRTG